MKRLLKIATREYLAYVKTPGFWLSILLLPLGFSMLAIGPALMKGTTPPPAIAVVDLTNRGLASAVVHDLTAQDDGGRPLVRLVHAPGGPFVDAADAAAHLRPYLSDERRLPGGDRLDVVAILRPVGSTVTA